MVDATDFSPEEEARLAENAAEGDVPEEPAAPASSGEDAE